MQEKGYVVTSKYEVEFVTLQLLMAVGLQNATEFLIFIIETVIGKCKLTKNNKRYKKNARIRGKTGTHHKQLSRNQDHNLKNGLNINSAFVLKLCELVEKIANLSRINGIPVNSLLDYYVPFDMDVLTQEEFQKSYDSHSFSLF